jgi:hypothetical protein
MDITGRPQEDKLKRKIILLTTLLMGSSIFAEQTDGLKIQGVKGQYKLAVNKNKSFVAKDPVPL